MLLNNLGTLEHFLISLNIGVPFVKRSTPIIWNLLHTYAFIVRFSLHRKLKELID